MVDLDDTEAVHGEEGAGEDEAERDGYGAGLSFIWFVPLEFEFMATGQAKAWVFRRIAAGNR